MSIKLSGGLIESAQDAIRAAWKGMTPETPLDSRGASWRLLGAKKKPRKVDHPYEALFGD